MTQVIKIEVDGEEQKFETCPTGDSWTHILFNSGLYERDDQERPSGLGTVLLRCKPKTRTFGGVVFEVEHRKKGETLGHREWGIGNANPIDDEVAEYPYWHYGDEVMVRDFVVLRPISIEVRDDRS